jgi:hypothetical protein
MPILSVKNRKKRNRAVFDKSFLLLFAIVSVAGLQLYRPHETPLPFPQKNGPVFTGALDKEAPSEAELLLQRPIRESG